MCDQLDTCCIGLESSKVNERKKCADTLRVLLNKPEIVKILNENERRSWDAVFVAVHRFIKKEGEKLYNDETKHKCTLTTALSRVKSISHPLFLLVVSKANFGEPRLSVIKILECVLQCFDSHDLRKYFGDVYLTILVKHALSERKYWGKIDSNKWQEIYNCLKQLHVNPLDADKETIIRGLYLTIKYGSLHSSLNFNLRREFEFIRSLCSQLKTNNFSKQEVVLQLLLSFSIQLAKECRMVSCKLGEEVSRYLIELYEPRCESYGGKKSLIFDFFLLQIRLHHPGGVPEGGDAAYAYDWTKWKQLLRSLYSILHNEIDVVLRDYNISSKSNTFPELWPNFLALFVEVTRQVFHSGVQDVTQASVLAQFTEFSQIAKRPRLETGVPAIISAIQTKDNWPWLSILSELLKTYPETLHHAEFMSILEILANLQSEYNNEVTRHYLYNLLNSMVQAQEHLAEEHFDLEKMEIIWTKIWETTLRSVGLNQNENTTHRQLQLMLHHKKSPHPLALLNIFTSDVLNISSHSIKTLYTLCQTIIVPELNPELMIRKHLINFILRINNEKVLNISVYSEKITAKLLTGLVIKMWPYQNKFDTNEDISREYKSIEDCYILSSFEGGLLYKKQSSDTKNENVRHLIHTESFSELRSSISNFCERLCNISTETTNLIHGIILLLNVLSEILQVGLLTEENFHEFIDVTELFSCLYKAVDGQKTNIDLQLLKSIETLFSQKFHESVAALVRQNISVDFLKIFFDMTYSDEVDGLDDMDDEPMASTSSTEIKSKSNSSCSLLNEDSLNDNEKTNLAAVRILSHYSCVPESSNLTQRQKHVLETLSNPEFDANSNIEFQMTVYLLRTLNTCKVGTISNKTIEFILNALRNMMETKYEDYYAAVLLLEILKYAVPHIYSSDSNEYKRNILILLEPFYEKSESFGCHVAITIADCMGEIVKMDSTCQFDGTKEVITKLLGFLKSSSHEVRLSVIKNILNIFNVNADSSKENLKRQSEMLNEVNKKVLESFIIDGNINKAQEIDEIANRTASALHMYSALIAAHPIWRKQTLYFLFQLVAEKKLHPDLIKKVLSIVEKYLEIKEVHDFLNNNVNYLLTQWNRRGLPVSNFPFNLFGCENDVSFFVKYINIVVPVLLQQDDSDILKKVCIEMRKSITDVLKDSYPSILAQFLPIYVLSKSSETNNITNDDLLLAKRLFKQLAEILNCDKDPSIMINKLDQVFIELLHRFFDCEHFKKQFDFTQVLPEPDPPFFTYDIFNSTLKYIEKKLPSNNQSIIAYCIKNSPNKLENILLEITMIHYNSITIEEKLSSFHKYSVLIDCIIQDLQSQNQMNTFLIRNIIYTLVNVIKLNKDKFELLSIAACRYFKTFCAHCLPYCSKIFEKFLILIVNTLVPIIKLDTKLSQECSIVLNLLIVENSKYLYNSIGSLDPFPKDSKFTNIQEVYEKIKYGNDTFSLEQEIRHFLNVGNEELYDRIEGLQHLRTQLSVKKSELIDLYSNLNKLRGFCEDCKNSILHQLICMLVKLTTSSNAQVRLEAASCLGELGPTDLTTLVLKPEQTDIEKDTSPLELVAGQIVVLLSKYLVSHETKVAKAASNALYAVVSSREGYFITASIEKKDYGCGILEQLYLVPFLPNKKPNISTNIDITENEFCTSLNHPDLWCPTTQCYHCEWVTTLVSELLKTFPEKCFLRDLIPVCKVKTEFSEQLLPLVLYLILCQKLKKCTVLISKQIEKFFENHWQGTMSNKNTLSQASTDSIVMFNRASVQCMLNVVHFIRLRRSICEDKKAIDELKLNYLHIAQAAQFCSAYFTSVLYAELWCYNKLEEKPIHSQSTASTLEHVCENQPSELTLAFENMLREAYKKIGDIDAMHGCGSSYILNTKSRIEYYKNIGRWDKVTLHYDTQLGFEPQTPSSDLANALKNNSLHYLASNIKSEELSTQYECAWRLNQWDFGTRNENRGCDYEKYHFIALKCLHETDLSGMNQAISQARTCVINNLAHASLESSKSLYGALTELQMLQEVENFAESRCQLKMKDLLEKWKTLGSLNKNEFDYIEPIRAQRITMLNDIYLNDNVELVKSYLVDMHLQLADEARTEGFYHVAHRSINNLSLIEQLSPEMKCRMLFEQAQLLWLDDKTSGRYLLKYLIDNNSTLSLDMFGSALRLYGNWMVETRSENPATIIENYFEKSLEILNDIRNTEKDVENLCESLDSYARFSDSQYQQVTSYIGSTSFTSKVQTIQKFRNMAKILKQPNQTKTSDEKRAIALYERQSIIDETEVNNAYKEKDMYLAIAVSNYLRILELSDSYNLKVFRILSLSLENKSNKDLIHILNQNLSLISSYKFIPLLPQLVPHIDSNQNDLFEKIIQELLERCAIDHPYHTLPIILALAESYKDRNFDVTYTGNNETVETRVQTAKDLITRLKKKKSLTPIINNMEIVSTALISLAYVDASKCSKGRSACTIPRTESIRSIKNLDNVLVPTINLEVRKDKTYNNIIGIREFSCNFSMVGGVNAPKKITCLGTDGIQRTQLVKGKDDLRQDAVMQQVFNIMNTLLAKNKQTSKLLIRTYKVVPLSQRSGVIEWCENTEPLGSYLNDAHKKYHPNDMSPNEARAQLRACHMQNHDVKFKKYKDVCSKLRPVFHMFFISSYPQPTIWFERRRAYMHSVATSSMVGYILGLGDRHVHNILLDLNTAEVIHIDFGIAFEQGRVLPTPETVPFRLTRDIEAGMGICGIEGVFRRSCEKTMLVLRQNAETVLTLLEVLLYDPLYVWTITPAEAYSRQRDDDVQHSYNFSDDDETPVNVTAERALLRLKQKLQGTENGGVCSVEGQVELLLQQARDPEKLSRLFNGWQAYL